MKSDLPLISVIIPVYNVVSYLRECLDSVVKQTYAQLEIILIDDGSTDESGAICDYYASVDQRIRVLHQKNAGLWPARNAGLDICTGAYITFVDSDDFLALDMIELLYKKISEQKADISICAFQLYEQTSGKVLPSARHYKDGVFLNAKEFLTYFFTRPPQAYVWAKLYRRQLFANYRFYNIAYEDVLMWVPLCKVAKRFVVSKHCGYFYRMRVGSITDNSKFNPHIFDLPTVWDKVRQGLVPYGPRLQELAAGNFYYHGYVCLLNYICLTNNASRYANKIKPVRYAIKRDIGKIFCNHNVSLRAKGACVAAIYSMTFYKILCRLFLKQRK